MGRTLADSQTRMAVRELVQRWRRVDRIRDILALVKRHRKLPLLEAEHISHGPWRSILAGIQAGADDAELDRIQMSLENSGLVVPNGLVRVVRMYEIDAMFTPLRSLSAHRERFYIAYCPSITRTILQDWRMRFGRHRIRSTKCKHIYLGRGSGATGFATHVFFPDLPITPLERDRRMGVALSMAEQELWVDQILTPALAIAYNRTVLQTHPKSFEEANGRARARQKESVTSAERAFAEHHYQLLARDG